MHIRPNKKLPNSRPECWCHFTLSPATFRIPVTLHLTSICLPHFSHPRVRKMTSRWAFSLHFSVTNNIEHLCMSLFVIHISFMKSLFKNVFCPFLSGVFVLFLTELQKLLIYYKYNFFFFARDIYCDCSARYVHCECSLPFCSLPFRFLNDVFCWRGALVFMKPMWSILPFLVHTFQSSLSELCLP